MSVTVARAQHRLRRRHGPASRPGGGSRKCRPPRRHLLQLLQHELQWYSRPRRRCARGVAAVLASLAPPVQALLPARREMDEDVVAKVCRPQEHQDHGLRPGLGAWPTSSGSGWASRMTPTSVWFSGSLVPVASTYRTSCPNVQALRSGSLARAHAVGRIRLVLSQSALGLHLARHSMRRIDWCKIRLQGCGRNTRASQVNGQGGEV
jgi:hypothetical protein